MINEKYSYKDFTGQDLSDHDPAGMRGHIVGSCFGQENPEGARPKLHKIFPAGLDNRTIFEGCNLTNVDIFGAEASSDCQTRRMKWEPDGNDWVQDDDWKPTEPNSIKIYEKIGMSIDPADIPAVKREGKISHMQQAKDDFSESRA